MAFLRFVEAGRVAIINYGEHLNKLVVIVDIVDQSRLLVEGPSTNVRRQVINVKRIALTSLKLDDIKRGAASKDVAKAYEQADIDAKFAASSWGQKLHKKNRRAALDDFGRFKVMVARMKKSKAIKAELQKLRPATA